VLGGPQEHAFETNPPRDIHQQEICDHHFEKFYLELFVGPRERGHINKKKMKN
jgi:hypothetical protein